MGVLSPQPTAIGYCSEEKPVTGDSKGKHHETERFMAEITTQGSIPMGLAGGIITHSQTGKIHNFSCAKYAHISPTIPCLRRGPVQQCHSQKVPGGDKG